ncbi:hypothetical protein [Cupriavidus necator]
MTTISLPPSFDIHELRRTVKNVASQRRREGAGFLSAHTEATKLVLSECVKQANTVAQLKATIGLLVDAL